MTLSNTEPEALRLANKLADIPWMGLGAIGFDNVLDPAVAELRRLHAEITALRKKVGAYKMLERAQAEQLSTLREHQDKFREAVASLQSERDANAILTAELEEYRAAMREALEALDRGHEAAQDIAHDMRLKYEGYMNRQQKAADNDVAKIAAAIEKLKARIE